MRKLRDRLFTAFSVTTLMFGLSSTVFVQHVSAFAGGDGTEATPYLVSSCADIVGITNMSAHYKLTTSLNCASSGNTITVGDASTPFTGVFDGGYHVVDISITDSGDSNVGLFASLESGGTLKHLVITGSVAASGGNTGMAVGKVDTGTIDGVATTGTVSSSGSSVGGLLGSFNCHGSVLNSSSGATVSGNNYVGGLIGRDFCSGTGVATVSHVSAEGSVSGNSYIGGLMGSGWNTDVSNASASGAVTAAVDDAGGLIGEYTKLSSGKKIYLSYATGVVTGRYSLGGLVGLMPDGEISQSYASGNVTGADDVGGLIGRGVIGSSLIVRNSYAKGSITTTSGSTGGLVGYGMSGSLQIINSYNVGPISTSLVTGFGGLVGDGSPNNISNSFWNTVTTNASTSCNNSIISGGNCGGTGANTSVMKTKSTYTDAGWDFTDIWRMESGVNGGYPYLLGLASYLCESPSTTATTGHANCGMSYDSTSINPDGVTWQARYKKTADSTWTDVDISDPAYGEMTFRNLDPSTDYDFSVKPTKSVFDSWATTQTTTKSISSDVDADGVADILEEQGPNNGDADGNGLLDSLQAGVATTTNSYTNHYTTLESDCNALSAVSVAGESTQYKDAGYDYNAGLVGFTATDCGATATFTMYFYGDYNAQDFVARKYNSATHAYAAITGATLSKVTVNGQSALKLVYQVVDNGPLDENPATGTITDPAGLATAVVSAPNTGLQPVQ